MKIKKFCEEHFIFQSSAKILTGDFFMATNLNDAEYFADTIFDRVTQLLNERKILKGELARKSSGTLEQDKAFVKAYQDNVFNSNAASIKIERLEHLLTIR